METALHALVSKVEKTLQHKEVALAIFFDIQGAFDRAPTRVICKALEQRGAAPAITSWTRMLLQQRTVEASLGNSHVDIRVTGGCPQGSCLSPHLWCLVMDGLLRELSQDRFCTIAYADDGLTVVNGKHVGVVCERMQAACRIIEKWCEENELSVNPTKTEMVLFT